MSQQPRARDATTIEASRSDAAGSSAASLASDSACILLVIKAPEGPRALEIRAGDSLTLGRSQHADIVVADPSLSRLHVRVTRANDRVRVVDLASRNGTWLMGQRIDDTTLGVGSTIVMGRVSASIQVAAEPQLATLGLLSTATMLELIEDECARSRVFRRPLSLLLLRASTPGALGIGELARRCAPVLQTLPRVAPYEQQSLAILLPETDAVAALRTAKLLVDPGSRGEQLACGVASLSAESWDGTQLMAAAWSALERCSRLAPAVVAERPRDRVPRVCPRVGIAPSSPAMVELDTLIGRLASRRISVLVQGETGTGKELVAHELHRRSPRAQAPLKVVNCAAIPESLIESVLFGHVKGAFTGADRDRPGVFVQAHGGTLFLDEVGELSAGAQAALLRVLDTRRICPVGGSQEIEVDVRVVAATHRDLASMADTGAFRLDLFHRLNSVTLRVPTLRERTDEIEALVDYFIDDLHDAPDRPRPRLSTEALERLRAYRWPGNVRELRNVVERALALSDGDTLDVAVLPPELGDIPRDTTPPTAADVVGDDALALRPSIRSHELALIREALRRTNGHRQRAAGLLQLPLRTLERKLKILGPRVRTL